MRDHESTSEQTQTIAAAPGWEYLSIDFRPLLKRDDCYLLDILTCITSAPTVGFRDVPDDLAQPIMAVRGIPIALGKSSLGMAALLRPDGRVECREHSKPIQVSDWYASVEERWESTLVAKLFIDSFNLSVAQGGSAEPFANADEVNLFCASLRKLICEKRKAVTL